MGLRGPGAIQFLTANRVLDLLDAIEGEVVELVRTSIRSLGDADVRFRKCDSGRFMTVYGMRNRDYDLPGCQSVLDAMRDSSDQFFWRGGVESAEGSLAVFLAEGLDVALGCMYSQPK